ncbi:MAG: sulfurtransferase [Propionivibrio sp.]
MAFTTIVSTETLAQHLDDPDWVILDARFTLDDERWGRTQYDQSHIPGALYADLATDLAGTIIPGRTGRRPLPTPETFAETLSRWGIDGHTQVVAYDDKGGLMAASRAWWMLRWLGHDRVAVLDGGWGQWLAEERIVTDEVAARTPRKFEARERPALFASLEDVDAARNDPGYAVFDSRSEEGFHGLGVYQDPVRGHIPGARLANRADTLGADGRFRPPRELRAHYEQLLGDVAPERAIFYCGSGVTAAQNLVALAHAGLGDARHYIGSWSEWILDPARPVAL